MEELFHLLREGGSADYYLVEVAAESLGHLLVYALVDSLVQSWHLQEQAYAWVLQLGEHLLLYYLLDNQRHGYDDAWLYVGESRGDDCRRRYAREVEHVATLDELEQELKRHAVHVGHGKDADDVVARHDGLAEHVLGEVGIAPHGAVWKHHALREARGAAGVVDKRQLIGALLNVIIDVLLAEIFGIFLAKDLVEVLSGIGDLL